MGPCHKTRTKPMGTWFHSFTNEELDRPDTVVLTGYTYIWTVPEYGMSEDFYFSF